MKTAFLLILILMIVGSVMAQTKTDKQSVIETIGSIFSGVDERDWTKVQGAMAKEVYIDYTSLAGGEPATLSSEKIIENWQRVLPGFQRTHHQIDNFQVNVTGDKATATFDGLATHYLNNETWTVAATYECALRKNPNGAWSVKKMKLNLQKQEGNLELPALAMQNVKNGKVSTGNAESDLSKANIRKVGFKSEGLALAGNLHLPQKFDEKKTYKAVVVTGSWTTVKEQMADFYAAKLADEGFLTLTFDFRNYGGSAGQPRNYENAEMKAKDIINAVEFLQTLKFVDSKNIGGLAVCASSGYMSEAIAKGADLKAVNFVAPWLHNTEIARSIYGEENTKNLIAKSEAAKKKFAETGQVDYVVAASDTDKYAAMFGQFDYYLNPKRGAIKEWGNQFAVMAWKGWLEFDPIRNAVKIKIPVQIIHSKNAAVPNGAELYYSKLNSPKNIIWIENATQFDFYDGEQLSTEAVKQSAKWFGRYLK